MNSLNRWALRRDERGVALVTAVLAMLVMGALATAGFEVATHNLDQSANDRRRTQAIHAAEAGIDKFLNYLTAAPTTGTACSLPTETLPSNPPSSFTVSATFYADQSGSSPLPCPPPSIPAAVLIRSSGTSAGVTRKMEGYYWLAAFQGGAPLFSGALYSDAVASFGGQATLTGNPFGADLYSNQDVRLSGGGTIYGSVLTQGALTLGGGTEIKQNAVSKLAMTLSGSSIVRGNAQSGTGGITVGGSSTIYGNATYCTGSAPTGVVGTKTQACDSTVPAASPWTSVTFTYNPTNWTNAGYSIQTFNDPGACSAASSFISSIVSGNWVVRINSTCQLSYGSQSQVSLKGDLAIISNGDLSMNAQSAFTATSPHKLYLLFDILTARPCTSGGISFNAQASIASNLTTLLYTPCLVSLNAQAGVMQGQIVAGSAQFGAQANLTFAPVPVPGPSPNGFSQGMRYRREVI